MWKGVQGPAIQLIGVVSFCDVSSKACPGFFCDGLIKTCALEDEEPEVICEWQLVFKAVKGNGRDVFTDFIDNSTINPNSTEAMVINSNTLPFKSQLLNEWDQLQINQVKVDVFKESQRKAQFFFDGEGSNRTDWFSQDRLQVSPCSNLKANTFAFFSAEGNDTTNTRFFIKENDGPCSEDFGFLAMVDTGADQCPWAEIEAQPYFLYNLNTDACCVFNDAIIADVMFVIDTSGSIDDSEFEHLMNFVKDAVDGLPVASDKTRIGAISFSYEVTFEFSLDDDFTQAGIQARLGNITNTGTLTRTDLALNFLKSDAFLPDNGNRADVPDVVVLLTDGGSTDPVLTNYAIANIASENYTIFAVGICPDVDIAELNAISSDPDSTFTLLAKFNTLAPILGQLLSSTCTAVNPPSGAGKNYSAANQVGDVFAVSIKTCVWT